MQQHLKLSKESLRPWLLLACFYCLSVFLLWPGVMSPDAAAQYKSAISGIYNDHHPPMMSLLWRYLALIYPGSAPMFLLHITMLYASAGIFIYLFRHSKFKWWYAIYPLLPGILAYTALVVKDAGFTFAYLLSGAIMTYVIIERPKRFTITLLFLSLILLFYGTAVKFQAKYILIFFTTCMAYCICNYKLTVRVLFVGVLIYILIFAGIYNANAKLVPKSHESHSWQFVKLYDLSAMSIALNEELYPSFIKQQPNYDFARIKKLFSPSEIDPLVFYANPVLSGGTDAAQRRELQKYWLNTVTQHPFVYLKVRFKLLTYDLITAPSERSNPVNFLRSTALKNLLDYPWIEKLINGAYSAFKFGLCFGWWLPILFLYLYIGIIKIKTHKAAIPLLTFSLSSVALLIVLLFFSMAGTVRYVFLCTCLLHISHGLAYWSWFKRA